jgi:hypothetical protein
MHSFETWAIDAGTVLKCEMMKLSGLLRPLWEPQ